MLNSSQCQKHSGKVTGGMMVAVPDKSKFLFRQGILVPYSTKQLKRWFWKFKREIRPREIWLGSNFPVIVIYEITERKQNKRQHPKTETVTLTFINIHCKSKQRRLS